MKTITITEEQFESARKALWHCYDLMIDEGDETSADLYADAAHAFDSLR